MARRREALVPLRPLPVVSGDPLSASEERRLRELLEGAMTDEDHDEIEAIAGGRVLPLRYAFTAPVFRDLQRSNHEKRPDLHPDPDPEQRAEVAAIITEIRGMRR